ncbi:HTTM domain-containing protein [Robiginitalea marina]|uniref:HTTM domain-containing protein n=1 Tax=Robiginitalea marina TaxID=2954105 RepID=A0ABT1AZQ0_9FLAO|nr:HTTM domain-containing protein [Robiginitalea marina]MCO5725082.1 HTTM domain-containing protein [Robiginitalea marina]
MTRLLFSRIDNTPLILFRVFFGLLISLECFGALATGWVRTNLAEPEYTFPFIGFEWLQALAGPGMYLYFFLMGSLGIAVTLGYRYRLSMAAFTLLWTGAYLMQKTSYNNHYYLLVLVSALMCFFPAHRDFSLDSRRNPALREHHMYALVKWIVVGQLLVVYTYAAIAKLYGDWFDFSVIARLLEPKKGYILIGPLLQDHTIHQAIGFFGIAFDFLIIPLLLFKPTRKAAFAASLFFHGFNSVVFQIGIFPFLSLAFTVFFFEAETLRRIFFRRKTNPVPPPFKKPRWARAATLVLGLYFIVQVVLPVRHHFIEGDVLWTEEGHRLSWRMMLRVRSGNLRFRVVDRETGQSWQVSPGEWVTPKQARKVGAYPDFAWQFAQILKKQYARKGQQVAVYARGQVQVNGHAPAPLIDPETDLASEPWDPWRHHPWILPPPPWLQADTPGAGE